MCDSSSTHMEWGAGFKQPGSAESGALLDIGQDKPWETPAKAFSTLQPHDSEKLMYARVSVKFTVHGKICEVLSSPG